MPFIRLPDDQLGRHGVTPGSFERTAQDNRARRARLFASALGPIYNLYIAGTDHLSFSDLHRMIRVPGAARIDPVRAHQIINDYAVAFFRRHLEGCRRWILRSEPVIMRTIAATKRLREGAGRSGS